MHRIRDYAGFGVWFLGLSYIAMWPLTTSHLGFDGGSLACSDLAALLPALCRLGNPQALPPLVHILGLLAAIAVIVRLLLIALRAARKPAADGPPPVPRFPRVRRPPPTVVRKSRDYFGLRGTPH